MADTARNNKPLASGEAALALAKVLASHNGGDVVALDVAAQAGWTDYFVIATATSGAHLRGLERFVAEEARALGLDRLHKSSLADDDEWLLADFGSVVVHVMTESARAFYELEKLWFQSPAIKVEAPGPAKPE
jgi:ribosome-associated protein